MDSLKKRLCWNCDASVSKSVPNCPYCGVYLHRSSYEEDEAVEEADDEESEAEDKQEPVVGEPVSPYRMVTPRDEKMEPPPPPPYVKLTPEMPQTLVQKDAPPPPPPPPPTPAENNITIKYAVVSLVALTFGVVALLFGFILLFFSHQGVLTLKWNAEFWYLYILFSFPLFFAGWSALKHIKD